MVYILKFNAYRKKESKILCKCSSDNMQIKSRELLRQVYVKKKHQFIKTVIQKNGHQTRSLGYVQKICVANFLEYFVDNVKQPFFFLVANPLIKQVSSCSQFLNY